MTLTYEQFKVCAQHYKGIADEIEDEWCVNYVPNCGEDELIYLRKSTLVPLQCEEKCITVSLEFDVIYSYSYSVPVLYFNACFDDGKSLSLDDVSKLANRLFDEHFTENKLNIVSQQEHPYRRTPCFMLHPCKSSHFLDPVLMNSCVVNPLVTWLSVVLPLFGCKVDSRFATARFDSERFLESRNAQS